MKMKHNAYFKIVLLITSSISSSILIVSPLRAASQSFSDLEFNFNNFNLIPQNTDNQVNGDNIAISGTDSVTSKFDGALDFIVDTSNSFINGDFETQAISKGKDYFGSAQISSQAIGDFVVEANSWLTFDFEASLNINNSLTNPDSESVKSLAVASFLLVDSKNTNNIYDSFRIVGNVNTNSNNNNDFLFREASDNIKFSNITGKKSFGGLQESAKASVEGSFQDFFSESTHLTLIANTMNESLVKDTYFAVPEPSGVFGWLLSGFGLLIFKKRVC